jgi:hypothetical protein
LTNEPQVGTVDHEKPTSSADVHHLDSSGVNLLAEEAAKCMQTAQHEVSFHQFSPTSSTLFSELPVPFLKSYYEEQANTPRQGRNNVSRCGYVRCRPGGGGGGGASFYDHKIRLYTVHS